MTLKPAVTSGSAISVEKQLLDVPWQTSTTGPLPNDVYSIGPFEV
jgi:hypothetical protein